MSSSKEKRSKICAECKASLLCLGGAGKVNRCSGCGVVEFFCDPHTEMDYIMPRIYAASNNCPCVETEKLCPICFVEKLKLGKPSGIKDTKEDLNDNET